MRIPPAVQDHQDNPERLLWYQGIRDACFISRNSRAERYRTLRGWYLYGHPTVRTRINVIKSQIDILSAYLYSDVTLRYSLTHPDWDESQETSASQVFTDCLDEDGVGRVLAQAVTWGLVHGCSIIKLWPSPQGGIAPYYVDPSWFGVYREDIPEISRQTALCQRYAMGRDDVFHSLRAKMENATREDKSIRETMQSLNWITGKVAPSSPGPLSALATAVVPPTNTSAGTVTGQVSMTATPIGDDRPRVSAPLLWVDELWIWDDAGAKKGTPWRMVKLAGDVILYDGPPPFVLAEQPFRKIEPMEIPGFFWGQSWVEPMEGIQSWRGTRLQEILNNKALLDNPPWSFAGTKAISEKRFSLRRPGSAAANVGIGGKVEAHRPPEIKDLDKELSDIDAQLEIVSEVGGLLQGRGPKSRDAGHAMALASLAAAPIKRQALLLESQIKRIAWLSFKILKVYSDKSVQGIDFTRFPGDIRISVAAHSASPLFGFELRDIAELLLKSGSIGPVAFLDLVNPPERDALRQAAIKMQQKKEEIQKEELAIERIKAEHL